MATSADIRRMFLGCDTAQNIISDQVEDRDGMAVWFCDRGPVTVDGLLAAVQDAWDATPISRDEEPEDLVPPAEVAALQWVADREGIALRPRWGEDYETRNRGIPREIVEAWIATHAPSALPVACLRIAAEVMRGTWRYADLRAALGGIVTYLRDTQWISAAYYSPEEGQRIASAISALETAMTEGV